jgi:hypothetical protein
MDWMGTDGRHCTLQWADVEKKASKNTLGVP